ncbi:MAG: c-type cytochrome [Deltaproteobacteria bacterium]|nr:c-type cytochrome [Deltaproteobacteria bacterium]
MKYKQRLAGGVLAGCLLLMMGCNDRKQQTKLTYMPDMADSWVVKAQLNFLEPPEGSVARGSLFYPPDDKPEDWEKLRNPYAAGDAHEDMLATEGAELYHNNCSPCHGKDADGQGSLQDKFPPAPAINLATYLERSDGFFFHKITVGGPVMPPRDDQTTVDDRWKIIGYLRQLQNLSKAAESGE